VLRPIAHHIQLELLQLPLVTYSLLGRLVLQEGRVRRQLIPGQIYHYYLKLRTLVLLMLRGLLAVLAVTLRLL
jgi:hypothetical protein